MGTAPLTVYTKGLCTVKGAVTTAQGGVSLTALHCSELSARDQHRVFFLSILGTDR